jgi:NADPH:quinone reductase-like Zn-dependent oxidoreductase
MPRIVRFHAFGGPEVLSIEDLPMPQPGPEEVRIAVKAIGLNRAEALFREGNYDPATLPSKIGYEAAGIVDAVGANVSDLVMGDVVSVIPVSGGVAFGSYGGDDCAGGARREAPAFAFLCRSRRGVGAVRHSVRRADRVSRHDAW